MIVAGTETTVEHCQHCSPRVWWIENDPGRPPQLAYTGFPKDGQIAMSKNKVVVLCRICSFVPNELSGLLRPNVGLH